MGIPLNIDWQQILLHLLNFVILAGGLYFLLYNPVRNFMKNRTAYYKELDDAANRKKAEAEALQSDYQKRIENAETEIQQTKEAAFAKAKTDAAAQIELAKEQSAKIITDAETSARAEREKIVSGAQQEIARMAMAATEKLLAQEKTGTLDEFLNSVEKE